LCDRWAFLLDARNASSATQKHKHLLKSRRVQNTLFGHPALARDGDAPLHEIKLRDRVRIGIDAEHAAKFERLADQATWRMLGSKLRDLMPVNVEEAWRWRRRPMPRGRSSNSSPVRPLHRFSDRRASNPADTTICAILWTPLGAFKTPSTSALSGRQSCWSDPARHLHRLNEICRLRTARLASARC
jgi:hypothetical protein